MAQGDLWVSECTGFLPGGDSMSERSAFWYSDVAGTVEVVVQSCVAEGHKPWMYYEAVIAGLRAEQRKIEEENEP